MPSSVIANPESAASGQRPWAGERPPRDLRGAGLAGLDLSACDFSGCDLSGADLTRANLQGSTFVGSKLVETTLFEADLSRAELLNADLSRANLTSCKAERAGFAGANLEGANLFHVEMAGAVFTQANLRGADLRASNLRGAQLRECDLREADFFQCQLQQADLQKSNVRGSLFVDAEMQGARPRGMTGYDHANWIGADILEVDFCGAYLLRRTIMDQNYIHEFRSQNSVNGALYWVWWATSDCGRSFARWALWTLFLAAVFAGLFELVELDYGDHRTFLSSFYYSVVTLTTLGYGDVVPASVAAQVVAMIEVALGYVMLGGLLSIFSNKMARRAD